MDILEWFADLLARRGWWEVSKEVAIPLAALAVTVVLGLLGILASLLVGGASVFVALYSWRTAERATKIAEDAAEAERKRDERAQLREVNAEEADRRRRVDDGVAHLIDAIQLWCDNFMTNTAEPSFQVLGALQKLDIIANPSERRVIAGINACYAFAFNNPGPSISLLAGSALTSLAYWRSGKKSDAEVAKEMKEELAQMQTRHQDFLDNEAHSVEDHDHPEKHGSKRRPTQES